MGVLAGAGQWDDVAPALAERGHRPQGASFVSLRAKSVDTKGNSVEQTVIRTYGLKPL